MTEPNDLRRLAENARPGFAEELSWLDTRIGWTHSTASTPEEAARP